MACYNQGFQNLGTRGWTAPEVLNNQKKTLATDIFALGCLIYYIDTLGEHPFGSIMNREINIINNKINIGATNDHILRNLVLKTTCFEPTERLSIKQVYNHPYFWTNEQKMNFIQEFSDCIESIDKKYGLKLD